MANWGNLNLGNLSSALSITGADPDFIERLRQEEAAKQLAGPPRGGPYDQYSDEQLSDPVFVDKLLGPPKQGAPQQAPVDRNLPPKAEAALANYRENFDPSKATGNDTGIGVQRKRHPDMSNAETQPYDAAVAQLGGGDLGVTGRDERLPLVNNVIAGSPGQARLPEGTDAALARVRQSDQGFELPEGTDQALARLSGQPRAQLAAPPRMSENDGVGRLQQLSAQNARNQVDVESQRGDLGAELGQTRRALVQDDATSGAMRTDEAMQRRGEALERKDENTKTAYEALHAMQHDLGYPPDTSKGRVLQIIGMVLSANKRTEGVGKGLQMLGGMMGDDVQKWSQGIEANEKIYKSFQEMNRHEDASVESELRQEGHISTMVAANTLNSIKAAEEEAGSADAKLVARQLGNKVQEQWLNHQTDLKLRMDAAAREQGSKADLEEYMRMPPEALQALVANGQFPDGTPINATAAHEALAKRTKLSQDIRGGEADIRLKEAQTGKLQNEQGSALAITGLRPLPGASEKDKPKAQEVATGQVSASEALTRMEELQGVRTVDAMDEYNLLFPIAVGGLNAVSNAGVVNPGEMVNWEKRLPQHALETLAPADGEGVTGALWNTAKKWTKAAASDEKGLLSAARDYGETTADRKLRMYNYEREPVADEGVMKPGQGLAPAGAAPGAPVRAGGGDATPRAGGSVHMVNPDTGEEIDVVPGKVKAAEALNFVVGRGGPRPAAKPPRDESTLAEAPRQSRDAGVGAGY